MPGALPIPGGRNADGDPWVPAAARSGAVSDRGGLQVARRLRRGCVEHLAALHLMLGEGEMGLELGKGLLDPAAERWIMEAAGLAGADLAEASELVAGGAAGGGEEEERGREGAQEGGEAIKAEHGQAPS